MRVIAPSQIITKKKNTWSSLTMNPVLTLRSMERLTGDHANVKSTELTLTYDGFLVCIIWVRLFVWKSFFATPCARKFFITLSRMENTRALIRDDDRGGTKPIETNRTGKKRDLVLNEHAGSDGLPRKRYSRNRDTRAQGLGWEDWRKRRWLA